MAGTAVSLALDAAGRARARRLTPPVVLTDRRGLRFELIDQHEIASFLRHGGHFERAEIEIAGRIVQPGDTTVDVGANIGYFAIGFAKAVGPAGAVYAFEPSGANLARLRRNLELNGSPPIHIEELAVGAEEGTLRLADYGPGYGSWSSTVRGTIESGGLTLAPVGTEAVDAVRLDAYAADHGIEHIDLLKVDVEGAEPAVVEGMAGLLAAGAVDLMLIEVSDETLTGDVPSYALLQRLEDAGMRAYVARPDGRLEPYRPVGHVFFANVVAASLAGIERLRKQGLLA
jgi:FkbM family methyltransferase